RVRVLPTNVVNADLPVKADANGVLKKGYRSGEVIKMAIVKNFSWAITNGGDTMTLNTTYTPLSANSTIRVTYDCEYRIPGSGNDIWYSYLYIDNLSSEVTRKRQEWDNGNGGGTRSTTLLPITGSRTITNTNVKNIRIVLTDIGSSSDDEIEMNANNGTMVITEIAN
ncbi:MAG: hypothetical protein AB8B52_03795, partial [Winogradskyella sp.]|uniref:hypothetical protein n=1 Tax=Winogradskyella sp. TaxID=1883156 RepID=UPI00385F41F2